LRQEEACERIRERVPNERVTVNDSSAYDTEKRILLECERQRERARERERERERERLGYGDCLIKISETLLCVRNICNLCGSYIAYIII